MHSIRQSESLTTGPVIGLLVKPEESSGLYVDAVVRSGGVPRFIHPDNWEAQAKIFDQIDGLLIGGEPDFDALWHRRAEGEGWIRNSIELSFLKIATDRDLPVLGVCRGMQALNIALGGSITTDPLLEKTHGKKIGGESALHRVYIAPGSKLAAIVGSGGIVRVNSRHRQCVTEQHKSSNLLASAYSLEDGVIEGLESPDHQWVIGVQFHPERRLEVPPHFERLFQSFVERATRI